MRMEWTQEQLDAIAAENNTLLVSAAAGSGKTAVLVARVKRLIEDEYKLNRMLIITFTEAAAAEMKGRLQKMLREEAQKHTGIQQVLYTDALEQLPEAQISTIDAFCRRILKEHAQELHIDPNIRIGEDAVKQQVLHDAVEDAINALLEQENAELNVLTKLLPVQRLQEIIPELYLKLMSLYGPMQWLERMAEEYTKPFSETIWISVIKKEVERLIPLITGSMETMRSIQKTHADIMPKYIDTVIKDEGIVERILAAYAEGFPVCFEKLHAFLPQVKFATITRWSSKGDKPQSVLDFAAERDLLKGYVEELRNITDFGEEAEQLVFPQLHTCIRGIAVLLQLVHSKNSEAKRSRRILDFYDLEQLAAELIVPPANDQRSEDSLYSPDIQSMWQDRFDHIFVDECQDISPIQDSIIQALHSEKNALFLVGDVKQSIYRFRSADPALFQRKKAEYSTEEGGPQRSIDLQANFRSTPAVLEATNQVFRLVMTPDITELSYTPKDELITGKYEANSTSYPQAEVLLLRSSKKSKNKSSETDNQEEEISVDDIEAEIDIVAEHMKELKADGYQIGTEHRSTSWKDFVILLDRVAGIGETIAKGLQNRGIPVYIDGKSNFSSIPEIAAVRSILSLLENPLQDIPLAHTLRLPGFDFTDFELAQIRLCGDYLHRIQNKNSADNASDSSPEEKKRHKKRNGISYHEAFNLCCSDVDSLPDVQNDENHFLLYSISERCRKAAQKLNHWRLRKETMRLSEFLWYLLQDSGYYAVCGAYPEGELRQANLRILIEKAVSFEETGDGTCSGFLNMLQTESNLQKDDGKSAKLLSENDDVVRIMTMHKSKGLQFPVVFLMHLQSKLTGGGNRNSQILFHSDLGLTMDFKLRSYVEHREMLVKSSHIVKKSFEHRKKLDNLADKSRLLYVAMTRAEHLLICSGVVDSEYSQKVWKPIKAENSTYRKTAQDLRVYQAKSMLDWIMLAVCNAYGCNPVEETTYTDVYPWRVRVLHAKQQEEIKEEALPQLVEPVHMLMQNSAESSMPQRWEKEERPEIAPLKSSVTSLVRQKLDILTHKEEETPEDKRVSEKQVHVPVLLGDLSQRPAFLQTDVNITGAQRGSLIHAFYGYFHLELLHEFDLSTAITTELQRMEKQKVFNAQELQVLRTAKLAAWYNSPLGKRMLASKEIHREWSFTLILDEERGSLLQGVIDCAFLEDDQWVIVDYKTDYITDEAAFVAHHSPQLQWYTFALEQLTGRKVKSCHLWSIGLQKAYSVDISNVSRETLLSMPLENDC